MSQHATSAGPATRKYKNDFLKKVIVRVDFAKEIDIGPKGPPASFIGSLRSFPVSGLKVKVEKSVAISAETTKESTQTFEEWTYRSRSGHKLAVITKRFFYIAYNVYNTYESLRGEFLSALGRVFQEVPDVVIGRLGLRYIDHIELDEPKPTVWDKYLTPQLFASLTLADKPETVSRAFHVLELAYPDETKLRFQYGMPNPDYPAPIKRKLFVLDCDAFCKMIISHDAIPMYLDLFHSRTNAAFEQVITDALRRKMGPK
jgi:uncharacterized protein (TIGR04255 family)